MTKCDLFVAVWLVLVFYTTRRVEGGIREKLQEPVMAYQKDSGALLIELQQNLDNSNPRR